MPSPPARLPEQSRFQAVRPEDLRSPPRWHRFSYIARHLPAVVEELVPLLEVGPEDRVVDYGCAEVPYRRLFPASCDYVAADLPGNPAATVEVTAEGALPLDEGSCDAVLSTQALEHVEDPSLYLAEAARVLRPGGRILLSTHGLMVLHRDPVDLWRWTSDGLTRSVERAGFEIERFDGVMGLTATGIQLMQDGLAARAPGFALKPLYLVMQALVALADRYDTDEGRREDALVFALVARRS